MTVTAKITRTLSVPGATVKGTVSRVGTDSISGSISMPAGIAGTLTAKDSSVLGTLTLATGNHGFYPKQLIDVYFNNGTPGNNIYAYTDAEVVSIDGPIVDIDVTDAIKTNGDLSGRDLESVCVASPQFAFDLSDIDAVADILTMAVQVKYNKTSDQPTILFPYWFNVDDDHQLITCPSSGGKIWDTDATYILDGEALSDLLSLPTDGFVYGKVSNNSSGGSATFRYAVNLIIGS